jgi:hypothetical protein
VLPQDDRVCPVGAQVARRRRQHKAVLPYQLAGRSDDLDLIAAERADIRRDNLPEPGMRPADRCAGHELDQ